MDDASSRGHARECGLPRPHRLGMTSELERLRQDNARLRAGIRALISYLERTAAAERAHAATTDDVSIGMSWLNAANVRTLISLKLSMLLRPHLATEEH